MKQKVFSLIIFLILLNSALLVLCPPFIYYRLFPHILISLQRGGAFSQDWREAGNFSSRKRTVLGTRILPTTASFQLIAKKASPLTTKMCQQKLSSWLLNQGGNWGVVVYDLGRKEKFSYNASQKFHAASVMKLTTAVAVFDWMEENQKGLNYIVWGMNLENRLILLINKSDNNQWADLGSLVSLERTQKIIKENGLTGSDIYTNTMTVEDVYLLLKKIYEGELINVENRKFLFKIMQNTIDERRIPLGIPEDIAVAHKTGTWEGNIHDAAIVFWESPYILVVMTNGVSGVEPKIANFSSQVFSIFSEGNCY